MKTAYSSRLVVEVVAARVASAMATVGGALVVLETAIPKATCGVARPAMLAKVGTAATAVVVVVAKPTQAVLAAQEDRVALTVAMANKGRAPALSVAAGAARREPMVLLTIRPVTDEVGTVEPAVAETAGTAGGRLGVVEAVVEVVVA